MSETKEIIELFQRADQMMTDYIRKVEDVRQHILARLQQNVPLPAGVQVALKKPDDATFLEQAYRDLGEDIGVLTIHRQSFRRRLAVARTIADVEYAQLLMIDWSNNADHSMETVLDYDYMESDILAPPYIHWQPIREGYQKYFRHEPGSPDDISQSAAILLHLNTVQNPWVTGAHK